MSEQVGFFEAYDAVLAPLFTASNVLHLVSGAERSGLMDALRQPKSVDALVEVTSMPATTVATICRALLTAGVVRQDGAEFQLAEEWMAVTDPAGFVPLEAAIAGNAVEGRSLLAATGSTYWSMSSADRLAYARAVSPNPFSEGLVEAFRGQFAADPDRRPMLDGGRLLELGCGLAGRVLTTLRAAPKLTAVGVELSADLAAGARQRAVDLGLSDRFTVQCIDAVDFATDEPFDFGFWSQFFFPAHAREGALEAMMRALRPGAVLLVPLGSDGEAAMADPTSQDARDFAIWRVLLDSWGVPERTAAALVEELEAAGFVEVRVREGGGLPLVRAARP